MGFPIQGIDLTEDETVWLRGTKRSPASARPRGSRMQQPRTPVPGFQWADYAAKPGQSCRYRVIPMYGTPARGGEAGHHHHDRHEPLRITHDVISTAAPSRRGVRAAVSGQTLDKPAPPAMHG
jgi:hypothetical protein